MRKNTNKSQAGAEAPPETVKDQAPTETKEVKELTNESAPQEKEQVGELRQDGPTLEEFVAAGYAAENYPPKGYAAKPSLGGVAPVQVTADEAKFAELVAQKIRAGLPEADAVVVAKRQIEHDKTQG